MEAAIYNKETKNILHVNKILFISHDASRTGAPIVLLHLMRWLKDNTDYKFDVLLCEGGPLLGEFNEVAEEVFTWSQHPGKKWTLKNTILTRSLRYIRALLKYERFIKKIEKDEYSLVYANSARSSATLLKLIKLNSSVPIIQHIHELEYTIRSYCNPSAFRKSLKSTGKVIAVSKLVEKNLCRNYGLSAGDVELVYEFVPSLKNVGVSKEIVRKSLGIDDEFILMASGTAIHRKGFDLVAIIARELKRNRNRKFKLIWVGVNENSDLCYLVKDELNRFGLSDVVEFVAPVPNPIDYFNVCDLFLMLSREDPFPLVCLEVASLGKPILCFKDSVGSEEFIDDSTGGVIDYLNIPELCDRIEFFMDNQSELKRVGINIKNRVEEYSMEKSVMKIADIIKRESNDAI